MWTSCPSAAIGAVVLPTTLGWPTARRLGLDRLFRGQRDAVHRALSTASKVAPGFDPYIKIALT